MKRIRLLVIDPQNDFMDIPGAALPVPGANDDMARLAGFLDVMAAHIDDLVLTLDSHASVGIERTTFWVGADGAAVAPFTEVSAADARSGKFRSRHPARRQEAIDYLVALESGGERKLIVWPVHCVLGTWGHNIHQRLAGSIADWEYASGRACEKVLKGQNAMTEQYSAFRAEVPRADDDRTHNNAALMRRLGAGEQVLVVAGEALSHCVAASGADMLAQMDVVRLRNTLFLTDCMSPVPGFEALGQNFLQRLREHGVRTMTATDAIHSLRA